MRSVTKVYIESVVRYCIALAAVSQFIGMWYEVDIWAVMYRRLVLDPA